MADLVQGGALDSNSAATNLTPAPLDQVSITLAQGATTSSSLDQINNNNLNFDPTAASNIPGVTTGSSTAASPMAPTTNNATTVAVQIAQRSIDNILTNSLDNYIDVTYHINLGMVSYQALQQLQQSSGVQSAQLSASDYIVFASTGDNQTNTSSVTTTNDQIDYYNIQSLSFRSYVGHLPQNPLMSAIVDGKMRMYEPYGFQFREDIDDIASTLGYPQTLSPLEFVYRLEIWFNGYDPKTGEWVPQIPIPNPQPNASNNTNKSVIYYLVISAVEAKVEPSGTFYDLSFQQFAHYATRAENTVLHHDSIAKSSATSVTANGSVGDTFGSFLQNLGNILQKQVLTDTNNAINVTYKFTGLAALFDSPFVDPVNVDFSTGVNYNSGSGSYSVSANTVDLFTLVNNVMTNVQLVRSLLVQADDSAQFAQPTVWWNVRTNILAATQGPITDLINSNQNYTFEYIFEPVLSYRSRLPLQFSDWNAQVNSTNQQTRVQNMLNYGMLFRWYDYYFTGLNSEVIDFRFMFKNFYYMQIPYVGNEVTLRGQGANSPDLPSPVNNGTQLTQQAQNSSGQTVPITGPNLSFTTSSSGVSLQDLLSISSPPQSSSANTNNANPANQHQHRHRGPITWVMGDIGSHLGAQLALAAKDQYMRWDMLNSQMTVRFDPQWLFNPYMSGSDSTPQVPTSSVSDGAAFVYAHTDRMIYLNAFAPNQASFMNPNVNTFNVRQTPILGGFYQVIYVENEFNGAQFQQKLNMVKYDHLNYYNYNGGTNSSVNQNTTDNSSPTGTPVNPAPAVSNPDPNVTPDVNLLGGVF